MSDENKKEPKKPYFRINTHGEISETSRKAEITNPGTEPSQFSGDAQAIPSSPQEPNQEREVHTEGSTISKD